MFFDTHAHLNFDDFNSDIEEIIKRCKEKGVPVLNVGTGLESSKEVVSLAKENEGLYASLGIHPLHIKEESFSLEEFENLLCPEVVAVGETGLDKKGEDMERQKELFREHIEFGENFDLPLILHCRKAHKEMLSILEEECMKLGVERGNASGVVHCFTGGKRELHRYLDLGFSIGLNGIIFKMDLEEVIKETPLRKILLETDCPFLSPLKEKKRNEPVLVEYIAKEVARIKGLSLEEVAKVTTQNAREMFKI